LNLVYSTFLGGTNNDVANGIAVDNTCRLRDRVDRFNQFPEHRRTVFVHGHQHTSFPPPTFSSPKSLTAVTDGVTNAVIAWSAVFGGSGADIGYGVAVDRRATCL